jgi:hypothetical protein
VNKEVEQYLVPESHLLVHTEGGGQDKWPRLLIKSTDVAFVSMEAKEGFQSAQESMGTEKLKMLWMQKVVDMVMGWTNETT